VYVQPLSAVGQMSAMLNELMHSAPQTVVIIPRSQILTFNELFNEQNTDL